MKKLLLFTILIISNLSVAQAPTNGLVGYFGFENNLDSNNPAHSFSQGSFPSTLYVEGKYGTGVSFGSNGYSCLINDSMDAVFPTTSEFTISFWQKASTPTVNYASSFEMFGSLYFRSYTPNGFNYFGFNYNATSNTEKDANPYASYVNTWTHYTIIMKIDPVTNYRWFMTYVNGSLYGSYNMGFQYGFYKFIPRIILGGGTVGGNGQYSLSSVKKFIGVLDEFYIYDRALSDAEILAVMNNASPTISAIAATTNYNSANISYSLNANGNATTSVINYGLTASSLSNQASGISSSGTTPTSGIGNITGLLPNTTYYYQIVATNAAGTTNSVVSSFTTSTQTPIIAVNNVTNTSLSTSTINYTLNANNAATTTVINYGTSSSNLNLQVVGGNASGTTTTSLSSILTGLTPGITYYYQIVATNSFGTSSTSVLNFTQINPDAIAEYNFDNTYNNIAGNTPFNSGANITFISDRAGQTQKALRLNGNTSSAAITGLPTGNAARSISVWAIIPISSSDSRICFYGALTTNQTYGISVQNNNLLNFGYANDLVAVGSGFSGNVWVHIVTTFDGTTAKIYRNGIEVMSGNKSSWNTANSGLFTLGGSSNIGVDDLKIYNRVLTQAEITSLYNNNSILSSQSYNSQNLKATIYPNPTSDNFTIEMENEVKSVEIYSIQGQKVVTSTSKNIDVSNLSKGIYLIRIEDSNNAVATQKLVIK